MKGYHILECEVVKILMKKTDLSKEKVRSDGECTSE